MVVVGENLPESTTFTFIATLIEMLIHTHHTHTYIYIGVYFLEFYLSDMTKISFFKCYLEIRLNVKVNKWKQLKWCTIKEQIFSIILATFFCILLGLLHVKIALLTNKIILKIGQRLMSAKNWDCTI